MDYETVRIISRTMNEAHNDAVIKLRNSVADGDIIEKAYWANRLKQVKIAHVKFLTHIDRLREEGFFDKNK